LEYACGCFERHASGDGIAASACSLVGRRKGYRGLLKGNRALSAHDVFAAFESGDKIATEVLKQAIEFWGMASANLVSLFNPELIVFGGGVFGPATQFLDAIEIEARRWAQPVAIEQVNFVASELGSDAALYGAASIALRGSLKSRTTRRTQGA
jgi:glucokinase